MDSAAQNTRTDARTVLEALAMSISSEKQGSLQVIYHVVIPGDNQELTINVENTLCLGKAFEEKSFRWKKQVDN